MPRINSTDLVVGAVGQLQFDVVAYRLKDEYKVEAIYEPVNVYTARWVTVMTRASWKISARRRPSTCQWMAGAT